MTDTRRPMTEAEFDHASRHVDAGWWLTGEDLIHTPSVMDVEGWNSYGHPGHLLLTPAQRTLMMWSDIVGQVCNGGFTQFCDIFAPALKFSVLAVRALDWPDLRERFERALTEQAGDAVEPRRIQPVALTEDPEKWAASRQRIIRHLARANKSWWQPITRGHLAFIEQLHDEWRLQLFYQAAVQSGELASGGERLFDFVAPPEVQASAFDDWFYTAETKAASALYVSRFIINHRDQLYRPV